LKPTAQSFQTIVPTPYFLPYWLFTPKGEKPADGWPLLLYLHGSGLCGNDLQLTINSELPALAGLRDDFPFLLVCPQCPQDTWWSDQLAGLDILLKQLCDQYPVDQRRVLVTGSSMGGYGVWHLASMFPRRFAGVMPLCGGGAWFYGFPERARLLKETPVWAFHGDHDAIIPVREAAVLVEQVQRAGGQARLEVIPGGHDIWRQVYQREDVWAWLSAQRRAEYFV
jgi:predicted peptidase